MTVERLEREMSRSEFEEWVYFLELEPFGNEEKMADQRNALACHVLARCNGNDVQIDDFLLYREDENTKINVEEMDKAQIEKAQSAIFQILTMR
jgi:hypothetical protein